MRIPIFLSAPTALSKSQEAVRDLIVKELDRHGLEPRALGRSDYPTELPLKEVLSIAKHCAGAVILGFIQAEASAGTWKPGTPDAKAFTSPTPFPTPWNQLEAGIVFTLGAPLLIFSEDGITGGVFDRGVTDVFVHRLPKAPPVGSDKKAFGAVFSKWQADVRRFYYR